MILVTRPFNGQIRFWNTCGWTDSRSSARYYRTHAEALTVVRRMAADGLVARVNNKDY
jgi:hypothetical protein